MQGRLNVMNRGGAVHTDAGDDLPVEQIDKERRKPDFDDVRADERDDRFPFASGTHHLAREFHEVRRGEDIREGIDKARECSFARIEDLRKIGERDLTRPRSD